MLGAARQPVLPDLRGVHPADRPRQRSRGVVRAAVGRDRVGRQRRRHRPAARTRDHAAGRRRRHARRHSAPRLRHQAIDAARLGECIVEDSGADPRGEAPGHTRQVLSHADQAIHRRRVRRRARRRPDRSHQPLRSHQNRRRVGGARRRHRSRGEAARNAFPSWSRTSASERGRLLLKLADAIEANAPASRRARVARHRPSDPRLHAPRPAAHHPRVSLLRRHRRQGRRHGDPGGCGLPQLRRPRADRCRRPRSCRGTSRSCSPAGSSGRRSPRATPWCYKPAELTPLSSLARRRAGERGRLPAGRGEHRPGLRQDGGPAHRRARAHRQSIVHRLDRHRAERWCAPRPAT